MKNKLFLFSALGLVILSIAFVVIYFKSCTVEVKCKGETYYLKNGYKGKVKSVSTESYDGLDVSKYNDFAPHDLENYSLCAERYDINGNSISTKFHDSNGLREMWNFRYDDKEMLSRKEISNKNGRLCITVKYDYNGEENQIDISSYRIDTVGKEEFLNKVIESYDGNCRLIKRAVYNNLDKLQEEMVFHYDNSGFCIKEVLTKGALITTYTYTYDQSGYPVNADTYITGELNGTSYKDHLAESYTTIYTFDEVGNWLTKQLYRNSEPIEFTKKTIKYW